MSPHRLPSLEQVRLLYIASSGIEHPLVVSQVLRYQQQLASQLGACHLMTLEREMPTPQRIAELQARLLASGIAWHPVRSVPGLRALNTLRDIRRGIGLASRLVREHGLNLVHARSFIPGNIGLKLKRDLGVRLLYDMRGFWAEEKWAKGTIKYRWMLKLAQAKEDRLFKHADALVSLTQAGKEYLQSQGVQVPITVIPCCVDTELFRPPPHRPHPLDLQRDGLRLLSVGSLGPGYLPERVLQLYQAVRQRYPQSSLQILTGDSRQQVASLAAKAGCSMENVTVDSARPEEVPGYLHRADVGLCYIAPSKAKLASSPTKLAEYLACGLPVVANFESIGDIEEILNSARIGVAVDLHQPESAVVDRLLPLLQDPELADRCRTTACTRFSLDVGVAAYGQVYSNIAIDQ